MTDDSSRRTRQDSFEHRHYRFRHPAHHLGVDVMDAETIAQLELDTATCLNCGKQIYHGPGTHTPDRLKIKWRHAETESDWCEARQATPDRLK